jgi:hypothetical protein
MAAPGPPPGRPAKDLGVGRTVVLVLGDGKMPRRPCKPGAHPILGQKRAEKGVRTTGLKKATPQALEGERPAQQAPERRMRGSRAYLAPARVAARGILLSL